MFPSTILLVSAALLHYLCGSLNHRLSLLRETRCLQTRCAHMITERLLGGMGSLLLRLHDSLKRITTLQAESALLLI